MIDNPLTQPQGRFALINGRIILSQEIVTGQAVVIEAGKIIGLGPIASLGTEMERLDVRWARHRARVD
jgi:hypothetical protein